MFSLVIPTLIASWHVSHTEAGLIGSITLVGSALGGWLGGTLADRIGRVRALQVTVLWFAVATFLSAFTSSFELLLIVKGVQGLGFGAEWAAGVVLMAEQQQVAHAVALALGMARVGHFREGGKQGGKWHGATSRSRKVASIQPLRHSAAAHAQPATAELNGPDSQGGVSSYYSSCKNLT